jgi:hypothetical protein
MYFIIFYSPATYECYTVVLSDGAMYGFDNDPFFPTGFGQYVGDIHRTNGNRGLSILECINEAIHDPEWLGTVKTLTDLPTQAQKYVNQLTNELS